MPTAAPDQRRAVTEAARPAGPERLILAFGDSLYAGYGLERGQSLPDAMQARLRTGGINATIVNAGVSGDTTAAGRQRLAFVLDNLPRKPDLVLLGSGRQRRAAPDPRGRNARQPGGDAGRTASAAASRCC